MSFEADAYLRRIGLAGLARDAAGLRALQAAQLAAIPFENVDPLLGRVPSLDADALARKLVSGRRGGYCFELNALLGSALAAFGFAAGTVLARVRNGAREGGARLHQGLTVECGGTAWLLDAGFGGPGPLWPLDLSETGGQEMPNGIYRVRRDGEETVVEKATPEGWFALYGFDEARVRAVDLQAANHLAATWDGAPFCAHLMAARSTADGRATLFNRRYRGGEGTRILTDPDDLAAVLASRFGVALEREFAAAVWERIRDAPTERPA